MKKLGLSDAILDGEVVVLDDEGKSRFHLLQKTLKGEVRGEMYYFIFDLLFYDGEDLRGSPLWERKQKLQDILESSDSSIRYLDHITGHGKEFFKLSCEEGLEGIIAKEENSLYSSGRSQQWIKLKCQNREEFVIGGWSEHSKVSGKIGALLLGKYQDGSFQYIGKVGTGFTEKEIRSLKERLKKIEQKASPFFEAPPLTGKTHWVRPEVIVETKFQNWTMDGVLRGGVYLGVREDKTAKEMEMLQENISSPEKIIFKKEGITKEMIARYYEIVSDEMLRLIRHRPLSAVRCPQGTSSKCFFQKHLDVKKLEGIDYFNVKDKNETNEYFSVSSPKGILELVQLNAYELHAWNCLDSKIESPNQIIFDLDPDENIPWKELVWASFELRDLLLDLQLDSFVKLTGGKGIHIHIPIRDDYTWEEVKSFAYTVGRELVERFPKKFTTNMSKKARKGKIFIDYLRNAHGATAVVPYSLRAKERATVALPIEWEELEDAKSGGRYGLQEALTKIQERKRDPWMNYNRKKQKLIIFEKS